MLGLPSLLPLLWRCTVCRRLNLMGPGVCGRCLKEKQEKEKEQRNAGHES